MSVNNRFPVVLDFVVVLDFAAPIAVGTFLILLPVFEGNSTETIGFFRVFAGLWRLEVMPRNPCPNPTMVGITNGMEIRIFREPSDLSRNTNRGLSKGLFTATMTIICSFLPLLIISGSAGEFIAALPVTVAIALTVSFIVAVMLTPISTASSRKSG